MCVYGLCTCKQFTLPGPAILRTIYCILTMTHSFPFVNSPWCRLPIRLQGVQHLVDLECRGPDCISEQSYLYCRTLFQAILCKAASSRYRKSLSKPSWLYLSSASYPRSCLDGRYPVSIRPAVKYQVRNLLLTHAEIPPRSCILAQ